MTDDPNKKKVDAWFVAMGQAHEARYFKEAIAKDFPKKSDSDITDAIASCVDKIKPSEGRAKLTQCVENKLNDEN
jgi:hypothetical protein